MSKMVGDKVVCERWRVKNVCERGWMKGGVSQMVCDKVMCERWCVKDGV